MYKQVVAPKYKITIFGGDKLYYGYTGRSSRWRHAVMSSSNWRTTSTMTVMRPDRWLQQRFHTRMTIMTASLINRCIIGMNVRCCNNTVNNGSRSSSSSLSSMLSTSLWRKQMPVTIHLWDHHHGIKSTQIRMIRRAHHHESIAAPAVDHGSAIFDRSSMMRWPLSMWPFHQAWWSSIVSMSQQITLSSFFRGLYLKSASNDKNTILSRTCQFQAAIILSMIGPVDLPRFGTGPNAATTVTAATTIPIKDQQSTVTVDDAATVAVAPTPDVDATYAFAIDAVEHSKKNDDNAGIIITNTTIPPMTTLSTSITTITAIMEGIYCIKRTFQPSIIRKKRKTGFLVRQRTVGGRRTLARRRAKGRWRLGGGI